MRKRSLHLPFTFATGEALLYQTSCPIPGFSDNIMAKGKCGKSKKTKVDKASRDEVDPSSLLGAMMRQDESVYVCQPASNLKLPYRSSLYSKEEQTSTCSTSTESENWNSASSSVNRVPKSEVAASFDPLLATLDSLSLGNEENCSNSELFNALENLGLNAEDLELLLLDERMIQVEMEPEYIPSLNDLLTNNEILSYIHDSLEKRTTNGDGLVPFTGPELVDPIEGSSNPFNPSSTSNLTPTSVSSPYLPVRPPGHSSPILHLSQQMQQHLSAQSLHQKRHSWFPEMQISEFSFPQHSSGLDNAVDGVQNGHWIPQLTAEEVSQISVKFPEPIKHQQPQCQNQTQSLFPYKQQQMDGGGPHNGIYSVPQWQEHSYMDQLVTTGAPVDHNMAAGSGLEFTSRSAGESGMPTPSSSTSSSSPSSSLSFQQLYVKQPPANYSYTNQSSLLDHILTSSDVYEMFESTQSPDSSHKKVNHSLLTRHIINAIIAMMSWLSIMQHVLILMWSYI